MRNAVTISLFNHLVESTPEEMEEIKLNFYKKHGTDASLLQSIAAFAPSKELMKKIIDTGEDVNKQVSFGNDKLPVAAIYIKRGNMEGLDCLLECGADPHQLTSDGRTLLNIGVVDAPEPLVALRVLIKHGADPNLRDGKGNTPLHVLRNASCRHDYCVKIVQLLVSGGAFVDAQNVAGHTPLINALERPNNDLAFHIALKLLQLGAQFSPGSLQV